MSPSAASERPIQLIAFDFDGTITTKDTFKLFLKYDAGALRYTLNILKLLPIFASYKLRLCSRHDVKAAVIRTFFTGRDAAALQAKADQFAREVIPGLIRPSAMAALVSRNHAPYTLYICSASISPYLKTWAKDNGIENVLAVELEINNGQTTGGIEGYNVWGDNKVRRIADEMGGRPYELLEAYGDTQGDKAMLAAAKASFWRPFER